MCGEKPQVEVDNTPLVKVVIEISVLDYLSPEPAVSYNAAEKPTWVFDGGEIFRLDVKEGERVEAGDVIAELDPTDYQLDVDNARFDIP